MATADIAAKLDTLRADIAERGKLAVAFSGGVDSTLLLAVAHGVLGDGACAITAESPAVPAGEDEAARAFCAERQIRHIVFNAGHLDIPEFANNLPERCYVCKKHLFSVMLQISHDEQLGKLADGSNTDDLGEHRPGHQALQELGVISPLVECGLSKQDVRAASRILGLSTAEKPSSACLATRFPYHTALTSEMLERVGKAEDAVTDEGLAPARVRVNGNEARIEVPPAVFGDALAAREKLLARLKELGYTYVSLDLQGYRSGSMDEAL